MRKHYGRLAAALLIGTTLGTTTSAEEYKGAPRTFLWNPDFNTMSDTTKYKKKGPITIGFANASQSDLWLVTFTQGVEWAAAKHKDQIAKMIITDANGDASKQVSDIQDLLNQNIDILLVNPVAADPLDPILLRAMKQGVPVVTVARRTKSDGAFVSFVTASDQALARISAQWLAEKLGGKGNVVLLPGLAGASPAEMRLQAAKEVFAQFPDLRILDTQYTSWSPANGKKIMASEVQRYGHNIQGVWADSGLQGSGAVEAFLGAGFKPSEIPPITGGDLNRMYKLAQENGFPFCGIDYTPSIGIAAIDVVLNVLGGKSVPKRVDVNFQVVVPEGQETESVKADVFLKDYVRMDKPDDLIMGNGMGPDYDPKTFKADFPH
jgi:ribose transport system substrate-binding protein